MDKVSTEAAYTTKEGINNVYLYTCHLFKTGTAMGSRGFDSYQPAPTTHLSLNSGINP